MGVFKMEKNSSEDLYHSTDNKSPITCEQGLHAKARSEEG